jgi:lipopolysaccharide transport system ATP-binding protein
MMAVEMTRAIEAKDLGKRYFLTQKTRTRWSPTWGRFLKRRIRSTKEFWALKNISFLIEKGESVGIIGPNGAGKTTLLRILSHVTRPTRGSLFLQGRVGSLIELGAGFHPELSGRENTFLYGSILGMKKKEILEKYDEIVAFAELDEFMDTPVKRYSSGMYVRLAFAIAVHVNPDILVVDEVLAVGDLHFQKKCFEWIKGYVNSNRTFLLVSHQLHQIENICQRVLYIKGGGLVFDGSPDEAISRFLSEGGGEEERSQRTRNRPIEEKVGVLDLERVELFSQSNIPTGTIVQEHALTLKIHVLTHERVLHPKIEIAFISHGTTIGQANTLDSTRVPELQEGEGTVTFHWPHCNLSPNKYSMDIYISDRDSGADLIVRLQALDFRVILPAGLYLGSGDPGYVKIPGEWTFKSK